MQNFVGQHGDLKLNTFWYSQQLAKLWASGTISRNSVKNGLYILHDYNSRWTSQTVLNSTLVKPTAAIVECNKNVIIALRGETKQWAGQIDTLWLQSCGRTDFTNTQDTILRLNRSAQIIKNGLFTVANSDKKSYWQLIYWQHVLYTHRLISTSESVVGRDVLCTAPVLRLL